MSKSNAAENLVEVDAAFVAAETMKGDLMALVVDKLKASHAQMDGLIEQSGLFAQAVGLIETGLSRTTGSA